MPFRWAIRCDVDSDIALVETGQADVLGIEIGPSPFVSGLVASRPFFQLVNLVSQR
jgi:hypothetical protein